MTPARPVALGPTVTGPRRARPAAAGLGAGLALTTLLVIAPTPVTAEPPPPTVVDVEIVSPHRLDSPLPAEVVGVLRGAPRWRGALRESVARLWALELFDDVRVVEEPVPGGVRLRVQVTRRPWLRSLEFRGDLGLPEVDLVAAAALAVGGEASPARLEQTRQALLALYRREGYFGARVEVVAAADPGSNARDVRILVNSGERARLAAIELRGLRRVPEERARRALGLRPGQPYREAAVRDAAAALERQLRAEGYVEARVDVAPAEVAPDGRLVRVAVEVSEGRRLEVAFTGNRALPEGVLRERLTFAAAGVVDDIEIRASRRRIEAAYHERGYAFARADVRLEEHADVRRLAIAVVEGPRVTVEAVDFRGDLGVPEARLRERLETAPPGPLRRRVFQPEALARDVRRLADFLAAEGFAEARVGPPEVHESADRTRVRVVIPVQAGPRSRVAAVHLTGTQTLDASALRAALGLAPGAPWSEARVEEARRVLERRYARAGYLNPRIEARSDRRDGGVEVTFAVDEGPRTRVGRILVRGLTRTDEEVVRRELPLGPGDPFDPEALVEAQRRLARLGLFESVEVEPLRPPPVPFSDVTVTVREGRPWHVAFGVGYSTFEGARGFVEAGHDNLFGTARSLALRLRLSERAERQELRYREPWLLGTRWVGDASLFHERSDEIGFALERWGLTAAAERELWPERLSGLRGALRYRLSRVDRFAVNPALVEADVRPGTDLVATVTPELTLDRRDRPLDPARGSFHLASVEVGGAALGGDADFVKARLETAWFLDVLPPTVLALGLRLGLAGPVADTAELPIEERFFAGGATTVRGYRERRLGPLDARGNPIGGNALLVLNAEWRFPLWRWLGGAVFFDAGAVTPQVSDLGPDALRSGVGAGLRVSTPVGPVRLDLGYPLDRVPGQAQKLRVHVTVGYPF